MFATFGPLVGYWIPLTTLIFAHNERTDTGLNYTSKVHFWMGWILGVQITILSILFDFTFLPIIRVWYDTYEGPTDQEFVGVNEIDEVAVDDID